MAECGAGNPDHPEAGYSCEYPAGHDRIWRYGAWQDHGAPSQTVWWVVAPYTEDELGALTFLLDRIKHNTQLEALLMSELAALRPDDGPSTEAFQSLSYGEHAPPPPARPEYRAAGYTVIEPRNL